METVYDIYAHFTAQVSQPVGLHAANWYWIGVMAIQIVVFFRVLLASKPLVPSQTTLAQSYFSSWIIMRQKIAANQ